MSWPQTVELFSPGKREFHVCASKEKAEHITMCFSEWLTAFREYKSYRGEWEANDRMI